MERRHEDEMTTLIEELIDNGWVKIEWTKFYRWFGVSKLHPRAFRDFYSRIEEVESQKEIAIKMIENADSVILLVGARIGDFKKKFE